MKKLKEQLTIPEIEKFANHIERSLERSAHIQIIVLGGMIIALGFVLAFN